MVPNTGCLHDLTEVVLTKNFFLFENDFYLQICGTAMGSKMPPNYANLYLGFLESDIIFNGALNPFLGHTVLYSFIEIYIDIILTIYIDNIFQLWTGIQRKLAAFLIFLNSSNHHLILYLQTLNV